MPYLVGSSITVTILRSIRSRRVWVPALIGTIALLAASCTRTIYLARPDLAGLYNRSAQHHGPDRNPIIVIPGLTGSRLVDNESGRVVWGVFSGDYAQPKRPEDLRLLALPMAEGTPLRDLHDSVRSDGVVERLAVRLLGVPVQLHAYLDILTTLGVGGYRDEGFSVAEQIDYGYDHFTCFQFDFDWRRDNIENAMRLHEFLEKKRAYLREEYKKRYGVERDDIRFDVVTHSMGSLLLRYYLRFGNTDLPEDGSLPEITWAGADDFEKAIFVAPPNAGSLDSLFQLVEGRRYGPYANYPPAVLGTYPSGYQMLPRLRHKPLVIRGSHDPFERDLYDPAVWEQMGWGLASADQSEVIAHLLPDEKDPAVRRRIALDHQAKILRRAAGFAAALDQPATPPPNLRLYLIAGDAVDTERTAEVDLETGDLKVVYYAAGDGKVLRTSALMDERTGGNWKPQLVSPVRWDNVVFLFNNHLGLTKDPIFSDNVLYWLLEEPR